MLILKIIRTVVTKAARRRTDARQTHDIAVSIGQSSITKLAKKSKDQKIPTTIIAFNLNLSETFHHFLVNMIF